MFLSHSSFRKRVKQEYTRLCQAKRAKVLSDVRSEIQENRVLLQQLVQEHASRTPPPVKPLPPELCSGVELVRNVSIILTNANGKTNTVKVRTCPFHLLSSHLLIPPPSPPPPLPFPSPSPPPSPQWMGYRPLSPPFPLFLLSLGTTCGVRPVRTS